MVIYCILTGLLVYYIALWLWYHRADSRRAKEETTDRTVPENQAENYTLIGKSRYKGGLIGTPQDKSGHLPQAAENDTIFAAQAVGQPDETPDYGDDEPDYEDEEIAGYMDGDDDTGRATGVGFDERAKRYARRTPTTPPKRNSGKPPIRWQGLRGQTFTMRWWKTSTAGWRGWRNCLNGTKPGWLQFLPKLSHLQTRNTKRSI